MLLAAIFGEVLRAPSVGHEARLPRRQTRGSLGGRSALSGVHSALGLRGGGGTTDDLRGGHSHGGENLPCRQQQRKLVFVGAPFCE